MKKMIKPILILSLTIASIQVYAQGRIEDQTVTVTVQNNTELGQATRTFEKNNETPPQPTPRTLTYQYADLQLNLPKLDSKVKVPMIKPDAVTALRSNYVKAGFGNYTAPYFEGFFGSQRNEKFHYGVHLKHLSYKNGSMRYSGSSENLVDLYGKYFTKSVLIDGEVGYQRMGYNYYGYNESVALDKDTIKQAYQTFRAKLGFSNKDSRAKFTWKVDGQMYIFSDKYKVSENETQGNALFGYTVNDQIRIELGSNLSVSNYKIDTAGRQRIWYNANPAVHYYRDKLHVKAGLNIAYANDTLSGSNGARVYPALFGDYNLIDKKLKAFASIDGSLDKNLLRTFTAQDPWLGQNIPLASTNRRLTFQAGLGGKALPYLQWSTKIGYSTYTNLYFFNNTAKDTAKFTVLYDSAHTGVTNFVIDLQYDENKAFKGGARAEFFHYKTGLAEALHRPTFQGLVYASYNLNRKIYFDANLYYISGIQAKNMTTGKAVALKPITDLSFKMEYRVSDRISGFMTFNNLLNKKYQRYLNYQSRGLNIMVGATVIF